MYDREWVCRTWTGDPGCPSARPALNTPCTADAQTCTWDGCCWNVTLGPDERCDNGQWTLHPLNACACGGPEQCPFAAVVDAGSVVDAAFDAAPDAGAETDHEDELLVSGCNCEFGETGSFSGAVVAAAALVLMTRRRRKEH